ncbi:unnamed protein product [Paramecium primaurelia]|uniref:Uncharacterized protein n=1 Tax=Paramecium primaurelia TaxID=5886 RepID=A0A8S1NUD1_PARPR|nr:unnamed protein product [Paramecium primaurelia]
MIKDINFKWKFVARELKHYFNRRELYLCITRLRSWSNIKDLELLAQFSIECFNRREYQQSKEYLKKLIHYADSEQSENLKSLNTINYLKEIAQKCDSEQFSLILEIFLKICLPQCLCPQLLNQIQEFLSIEIVNQFITLLQRIVYMNELDSLIEQHNIIQYILDITLELDDFQGWFLIIEQLCNYNLKPSLYFKNLIIPCLKLLQYDTNLVTLQIIETMCNCKTDRRGAINYLLIIPGFIDLLINNLSKTFNIISHIIEQSDDGTTKLIQKDLLMKLYKLLEEDQSLTTTLIYLTILICFYRNDTIILKLIESQLFQYILALDEQALKNDDLILISRMLVYLIRRYSNESFYLYLIQKTFFVNMLGQLISKLELQEVYNNAIHSIIHMAFSQSIEFTKVFRQSIFMKPVEEQLLKNKSKDANIDDKIQEFLNIIYK